MKRTLLLAGCGLLATVMLTGDGVAVWLFMTRPTAGGPPVATTTVAGPVSVHHGTLYFAKMPKLVVSLADNNPNGASYAQIGLSFSSYDKQTVKTFDSMRPIIKAAIIASVMAHADQVATGSQAARQTIIAGALADANKIVTQQDANLGTAPFVGAYLTDFLLQ